MIMIDLFECNWRRRRRSQVKLFMRMFGLLPEIITNHSLDGDKFTGEPVVEKQRT